MNLLFMIKPKSYLYCWYYMEGPNKQIIKHTKSRFNQLADRDKFYVVYPQGLGKGWNDGRNDLQQFA